jgi:hypothetical protein
LGLSRSLLRFVMAVRLLCVRALEVVTAIRW